jgi:hypothetical protein
VTFVAARFLVLGALLVLSVSACVPTAARKNARLTDGFGADLSGGLQLVEAGEDNNGSATASTGVVHVELDLEYAHKMSDGSGLAFQIKVPVNIVFTSFDFYYQLPENDSKWFFGFGAEVAALPGLYAVATHYVSDDMYLSLTPRVLNAKERGEQAVLINPQVSLGYLAGAADLSLFASYAYHTGRGFNFDIDLFGENDRDDYRKKYWLLGGSARF